MSAHDDLARAAKRIPKWQPPLWLIVWMVYAAMIVTAAVKTWGFYHRVH